MSRSRRLLALWSLSTVLLVSGCDSWGGLPVTPDPTATATATPPSEFEGTKLVDPLSELTDPASDVFVATELASTLHERHTGPQRFDLGHPADSTAELQFYISCSPDSAFTITLETFYSGSCINRFTSSGSIPLPTGSDPLVVDVDVPAETTYWIVAVPVSKSMGEK